MRRTVLPRHKSVNEFEGKAPDIRNIRSRAKLRLLPEQKICPWYGVFHCLEIEMSNVRREAYFHYFTAVYVTLLYELVS